MPNTCSKRLNGWPAAWPRNNSRPKPAARADTAHLFLSAALEQLAAPLRDFKPGQRVPAFKLDRALAAGL